MDLASVENRYVCAPCFEDDALRAEVKALGRKGVCSHCAAKRKRVAAMEDIVPLILRGIGREWSAADEELPWDNEEDGYLLAGTCDTEDMFEEIDLELPNDDDGRLKADILGALPQQAWCSSDPLVAAPHEAIANSWRSFCHVIKHERRFYFLDYVSPELSDDLEQQEAAYTIPELLESVASYAERAGLFVKVAAGTSYVRSLPAPEAGQAAFGPRRMGPPPHEFACKPNRMSPAGIPMFYGAEEVQTALIESTTAAGRFALGRFEVLRKLRLLDLRSTPAIPSLFDDERAPDRPFARFMREFLRDFRRPVANAPEVDYVPTQVVTEYFRSAVRVRKHAVDGILYASTRNLGGTAVVLFADTYDVEEEGAEPPYGRGEPWLRMIDYREIDFDPEA